MFNTTQVQELRANTTNEWTTINGKNGRKFTSKSDSTKYIFLPVGGRWQEKSNTSKLSDGYYFASTSYNTDNAYRINFVSYDINIFYISRYFGLSVRPIRPLRF